MERLPEATVIMVPVGRNALEVLEVVLTPLHAATVMAADDPPGDVAAAPEIAPVPVIERPLELTLSGARGFLDLIQDPVIIAAVDPDGSPGRIIAVNATARDYLGYLEDELATMTLADLDMREDPAALLRYEDDLHTKGEATVMTAIRTRTGTRIPVEIRSRVETIDGRRVVLSVARDQSQLQWVTDELSAYRSDLQDLVIVTAELRQTNEQLNREIMARAQVEERLIAAVAKNPIPTVVVLSGGEIASYNDAVHRLTGYARDEVKDLNDWMEKLYPDAATRLHVEQEIRKALETGEAFISGVEIVRKDGEGRTLDLTIAPFEGGLIVQMIDVTERWRAEEALRESEERYRALFDRSLEAVYVHDFEGRFLDANDVTLDMLGYSREDIGHLRFTDILDEEYLLLARRTMEELATAGRQSEVTEYKLHRKDGSTVWVETMARC